MKKVFLSLLTVVIYFAVAAQQVPRDKVILELVTATW